MRVLLTSPSMQAGGAERIVTMLAAGLVERGHEVALAAPEGVRDADLDGISHARYTLTDYNRVAVGAIHTSYQLAQAIHRFVPDVMHAQNIKSAVTSRAAASVSQGITSHSPILASFHGVLPGEYRRSAQLLRAANHVACVSQDLADNIVAAGLPRERVSMIPNAVTPATPLEPTYQERLDGELGIGDAPVIAMIGRLVPQKAHERFINAMVRISSELPETRALIVGEGPRRAEIERMVKEANLEQRVIITGLRSDSRQIIARSELVVFSSEWEGLSLVALESLSAGTPVVSTDVQGMRELFSNGSGSVVPLDDGTALGQKVVELLRDHSRREAMGHAGRDLIARRYSLSGMIDAYEQLYDQLIEYQ